MEMKSFNTIGKVEFSIGKVEFSTTAERCMIHIKRETLT